MLLLLGLFAVSLLRMQLVGPPAVGPDHRFDTQATVERMARILGSELPHPVDSEASDAVIDRLLAEIQTLGFTPEVDDAFHCNPRYAACARVRNVGFWVGSPGEDAVMIASHHDSVPAGPGAADDMMGVGVSLEIARLLRGQSLARPLYVLITDGEEAGLIGASRFVEHSPVAASIGAVVSVEARGTAGPATMFETSDPNGRDLAVFAGSADARRPVTNSLAVDIYRAMPNGTDVTEYLTLGMDAANYSIIGEPWNYHTARDDMAHLDRGSVFHIGANTLAGVEGLLDVEPDASDANRLYTDVWGLFVFSLPGWAGLPVLLGAAALCAAALFRQPRVEAQQWRVLLWPPLVLIAGTLAAFALNAAILALRPEAMPGLAHPWGLRGVQIGAGLAAAALASAWLYRPEGRHRFATSAWAWVLALGAVGSLLLPGVASIYMLPALAAGLGALLLLLRRNVLADVALASAAILAALIAVPQAAVAEAALFIEQATLFVPNTLWLLLAALPLFWREAASARWPVLAAAGATAGFALAALLVPAASEARPAAANIRHVLDLDGEAFFRVRANAPQPVASSGMPSFTKTASGRTWEAPAPPPSLGVPSATILSNTVRDTQQDFALRITAPDADALTLSGLNLIDPDGAPTRIAINGVALSGSEPFYRVRCHGRSCRVLDVALSLPAGQDGAALSVQAVRHGLGPAGQMLANAQPPTVQARGDGHVQVATARIDLSAASAPASE